MHPGPTSISAQAGLAIRSNGRDDRFFRHEGTKDKLMNNTSSNGRGLLFLRSCLAVSCALVSPLAQARRSSETTTPPQKTPGAIGKAILAEKPTGVLGGRLSVRLPEGSRIEARPVPIMGAPESDEHETRVIFDAGKVRLVLLFSDPLPQARRSSGSQQASAGSSRSRRTSRSRSPSRRTQSQPIRTARISWSTA